MSPSDAIKARGVRAEPPCPAPCEVQARTGRHGGHKHPERDAAIAVFGQTNVPSPLLSMQTTQPIDRESLPSVRQANEAVADREGSVA